LLSIKQLITSPYHPICNGLVEKFNGTLKKILKRLFAEEPKQWHRYINPVLFAYREVTQESTGFSPFEMIYGRTIRGPMQILRELWTKEMKEPEIVNSYQYVFELRERLERTLQIAQEELEVSSTRYRHYYDKKARPRKLKIGDEALILLPTDSNKILMQWKGPYKIEGIVANNDYKVNIKGTLKTFHINMLKKYVKREENKEDTPSDPSQVFQMAGSAIIEPGESVAVDDEDLLEFHGTSGKETHVDVSIGTNLAMEQKKEVEALLQEFSDVLTDIPGTTNLAEHTIVLTSNQPIRSKPYNIPYNARETLRSEVKKMLDMGIIRKSHSPYASPVVMVNKKDGTTRLCIDYRKLNKITVFDPEPITTAESLFADLSGDRYFTKIDLTKGYWQIPIVKEDIPKTAFVTPDGCYEFVKVPFGQVNSGAVFMKAMRRLLEGINGADSYVDDILIHTKTWQEHLIVLRRVFESLREANMTARPTKCIVGSDDVTFVGYRILQGFKALQEDNVKKIKEAPQPTTKKEVRSFLGLVGFYRDYIPNFAAVAAPLTDLTKNRQPNKVLWTEAQQKAYDTLKQILMSEPVLHLPDLSKTFYLRTDASDTGIGAVLMQDFNGTLFPISYASKKLSSSESHYTTTEKECLAIVWAVKKYYNYLYGREFILQTDHECLTYINKTKFSNNRIMRWAMYLQNFQIRIEAIKGSANVGADFLSRVN